MQSPAWLSAVFFDGERWYDRLEKAVNNRKSRLRRILLRWHRGFFLSCCVVGDRGVTAVDPIYDAAAVGYRAAIASVTGLPLTRVVYLHDHHDHICGGAIFRAGFDCETCAHESYRHRLERRGDTDIPRPTCGLGDGEVIVDGGAQIVIRYFGYNHSNSNLLLLLPTARGRMVV